MFPNPIQTNPLNVNIKYHLNKLNLSKLNILYLNINSIRNKLEKLENIITEIDHVHIIVLTEIRIFKDENNYYNINNYKAYFNNREDGHGGVAVYVHDDLVSGVLESDCVDSIHKLVIRIYSNNINIAVIYRKPVDSNFDSLIEIMNNLLTKFNKMIVMGDININLLNIGETRVEHYIDSVLTHGFNVLNKITDTMATRIANYTRGNQSTTTKSIIDHVISDLTTCVFNLSLTDVPISDHRQIILSIDDNRHHSSNNSQQNCPTTYQVINTRKFTMKLAQVNFEHANNFDDLINILNQIKSSCIETHTKQYIKISSKPWFNMELKTLIKEKTRYFKLKKKSPTNTYLINKCCEFSTSVDTKINIFRNNYNSNKINSCGNDMKKMWQTINEIITNVKFKSNHIKVLKIENSNISSDPIVIANSFNKYFLNVGKKLHDALPSNTLINSPQIANFTFRSSIMPLPTDSTEIISKINRMKINNNALDIISSKLLKQNAHINHCKNVNRSYFCVYVVKMYS